MVSLAVLFDSQSVELHVLLYDVHVSPISILMIFGYFLPSSALYASWMQVAKLSGRSRCFGSTYQDQGRDVRKSFRSPCSGLSPQVSFIPFARRDVLRRRRNLVRGGFEKT